LIIKNTIFEITTSSMLGISINSTQILRKSSPVCDSCNIALKTQE